MDYQAPLDDIAFTLRHVADLDTLLASGRFGELDNDDVAVLVEQSARFVEREIAPLNQPSDKVGTIFRDGRVETPEGWIDVYRRWVETGAAAVTVPPEWGGMGLPTCIETALMEMVTSGCMSFSMTFVVTQGAIDALIAHASPELKERYVPNLVSGQWTATMDLTEPQAGSDLSSLRTRAERQADGTYRIFGQKIFISYGEHDLAENIIHLVLARLPGAPTGTKGISLFVVPKYLVNADGSLGQRNDVACVGVEHKLGIRASPTCAMSYGDNGGAVGWLVGEENGGLACMFTVMNRARLGTGLQGVAVGERAYQKALAYARERRQGRGLGAGAAAMVPIIEHPDVQRMLMTMRALIVASRAICHAAAATIDRAHGADDADERALAEEQAALLTPVVKAFVTDSGVEVASLGIQIHGGMGFIEETGAAQFFRDVRIAPIYEGTNGMQAIDLVNRKMRRSGGHGVRRMIDEYRGHQAALEAVALVEARPLAMHLGEALDALEAASGWLLDPACDEAAALAVATPYLRLFALAAGGAYLAKGICSAQRRDPDSRASRNFVAAAHFFAQHVLSAAPGLARTIREGSAAVLVASEILAEAQ